MGLNIDIDKNQAYVGPRETYKVSGNVVAAAGGLAFLTLFGAAGKVLRVTKITISGLTLTAVQYLRLVVNKNSSAFTGGTLTNPAKVPLDSTSPASGATAAQYTVAPGGGGAIVGPIAEKTVLGQATTAAAGGFPAEAIFDFSEKRGNTPVALRGADEGISVAFGAAPATAVTLSYEIEYTEDGN